MPSVNRIMGNINKCRIKLDLLEATWWGTKAGQTERSYEGLWMWGHVAGAWCEVKLEVQRCQHLALSRAVLLPIADCETCPFHSLVGQVADKERQGQRCGYPSWQSLCHENWRQRNLIGKVNTAEKEQAWTALCVLLLQRARPRPLLASVRGGLACY